MTTLEATSAAHQSVQLRPSLALGEQISRDARARVVAAAGVVLVHSAYPLGSPALGSGAPGALAAALLFQLVVTFPVNAFILLSFLNLAPRLRPGVTTGQRLGALARRLLPGYLFWTTLYLVIRALLDGAVPSPRHVGESYLLGTAAAHLYFVPLLFGLTAAAPLLARLARRPLTALAGAVALGCAGRLLWLILGAPNHEVHAVIGFLGLAPFALAGIALARHWGGLAPGPAHGARALWAGLTLSAVSIAVLTHAILSSGGGRPAGFGTALWLATNGCALGIPLVLLNLRGSASVRTIRLARFSMGIYFVHPLFISALRMVESRAFGLDRWRVVLLLPNAFIAAVLSVVAVELLARSPLRRVVG